MLGRVALLASLVVGARAATGCASAAPPPPVSETHSPAATTRAVQGSGSDPTLHSAPTPALASATEPTAPPEPPAALEPARFETLEVPGFLDAVVALPTGNRQEPLLLATHGAGGAPEHHCEAWREQLGDRGIVVCPRGALINRIVGPEAGYYYPDHFALEQEVVATLASARDNYAGRLLAGGTVYAGYSQGATMGALMLPPHADVFPRVILVEGGFDEWALSSARRFSQNGGRRIAFVCGRAACKRGAEQSARWLQRSDVGAVSRYAAGAGHTYLGRVADEIAVAFWWLVEDDPRWQH